MSYVHLLTKLKRGVQLIYVAMLCRKVHNKIQVNPVGKKSINPVILLPCIIWYLYIWGEDDVH